MNETLKRALRRLNLLANRLLHPVGLHFDLDFTYTASYLYRLENLATRLDEPTGREDAAFIRRFAPRDGKVLDIGSGGGRVEKELASSVEEAHGCDVALGAVKISRRHCRGQSNVFFTHLKEGARSMPDAYAANSFDTVFSIATLQHMPREEAYLYLEEAFRVLKPDGIALFHFPNLLEDRNLMVFQEYSRTGNRHLTRMHHYTPQEVERLVGAAGFRVQTIEDHYRFEGDIQVVGHKPK